MNRTKILSAEAATGTTEGLARLAFVDRSAAAGEATVGPRHLAFLTPEDLDLDLNDPSQRAFGDYELLEKIGQGGMGVVYRARQNALDREVAIKLLAAGPWASSNFIERFRAEAQSAARMAHPNIVTVFETGVHDDLHYFSMMLVRGRSLSSYLRELGARPATEAARLMRTIAEAVDYAHRLGVLHLDLKPGNILLDESGQPLVADFGLARRLDESLVEPVEEVSGTPSYMAPEQARAQNHRIGTATDIYGLGAILYELLTGIPPFLAATPQETLKRVVEESVQAPRQCRPGVPADLDAICMKCLAKEPADRYASAGHMADDLARWIDGRPVSARPLGRAARALRWARREPRLAGALAAVLVAVIAGLVATTLQWQRAQHNFDTANGLLWQGRREAALALVRDGQGLQALAPLAANVAEKEGEGRSAADERLLAGLITSQGVTLIDRMIIPDGHPMTAALSRDGKLLAIGLNDVSVRWYDTATMTERGRLDLSDESTSDGSQRVPLLLRFVDDHRLLVTLEWYSFTPSPSDEDSLLVDLDHARVVRPPENFGGLTSIAWRGDGKVALLHDDRSSVQLWQVDPWRPLSPLETFNDPNVAPALLVGNADHPIWRASNELGTVWSEARHPGQVHAIEGMRPDVVTAWSASADGRWLAIGDAGGHATLIDMDHLEVRRLPLPSGRDVSAVAFSGDGAWLGVGRRDGSAYLFDTKTGAALHAGPMQNRFEITQLSVSHRQRLVLAGSAGDVALWRLPEAGPGGVPAQRLFSAPAPAIHAGPYWAQAAFEAGLLVTADMDGEVRLWRLPHPPMLAAKAAQLVVDGAGFDGRKVADVVGNQLRAAAVDGGKSSPWISLPHAIQYATIADGGRLLLASAGSQLWLLDAVSGHSVHPPIELPATPQHVVLSDNGRVLAMSFGHNTADGFFEQLQVWRLGDRHRIGTGVAIQGPLRQLRLSADGSCLLTVGPERGAVTVFASQGLKRIGSYPNDPAQPALQATFAGSGAEIWLLTRDVDAGVASQSVLTRWDASSGKVRERRRIADAEPVGIGMMGGQPLLFTSDRMIADPGGGKERRSPRQRGEAASVYAVSHDGRLLAQAWGQGVQIYDAATLTPIGPPLPTQLHVVDATVQLAFADDDRRLLGLARSGHWLVWSLRADPRSPQRMREAADLLAPDSQSRRVLRMATPSERQSLRADDPGSWGAGESRPLLPTVPGARVNASPDSDQPKAVPARDPAASPLQLDLSDYYVFTPLAEYSFGSAVLPTLRGLPFGLVRLDGVEFDLRGDMELVRGTAASRFVRNNGVNADVRFPVPAVPLRAVHLLLYAPLAVPEPQVRPYLNLHLHYHDGTEEVVSAYTQRDIPGGTDRDRPTPLGWIYGDRRVQVGASRPMVFAAPTLINPHPDRIVDAISLEGASASFNEAGVLAITLEPVSANAASAGVGRER